MWELTAKLAALKLHQAAHSLTYLAQYQAFGNQVATFGSTLDRQKSNSKDTDPTGLVDEGRRYYSLLTETFTTRDPAGMIDGPNEYCYVRQNPWTSFDPEGLMTIGEYDQDIQAQKQAEQGKPSWIRHEYDVRIQQDEAAIGRIEETAKDLYDTGEVFAKGGGLGGDLVAQQHFKDAKKVLESDDASDYYKGEAAQANLERGSENAIAVLSLLLGPDEAAEGASAEALSAGTARSVEGIPAGVPIEYEDLEWLQQNLAQYNIKVKVDPDLDKEGIGGQFTPNLDLKNVELSLI